MLKITAVDWLEKSIVTCTYLIQGQNFDTFKQKKYKILYKLARLRKMSQACMFLSPKLPISKFQKWDRFNLEITVLDVPGPKNNKES